MIYTSSQIPLYINIIVIDVIGVLNYTQVVLYALHNGILLLILVSILRYLNHDKKLLHQK